MREGPCPQIYSPRIVLEICEKQLTQENRRATRNSRSKSDRRWKHFECAVCVLFTQEMRRVAKYSN